MRYFIWLGITLLVFLGTVGSSNIEGGPSEPQTRFLLRTAAINQPATDEKTHTIGQLWFTISNWGFFGSQRGEDNPYYCIVDENTGKCRPSAEYPGGSGIEYLFQGALWIGAVVSGETLVSIGEDGWFSGINELMPSYLYDDTIKHRSTLNDDIGAISEEDYYCDFADTCRNPSFIDPSHKPIGVAVHQESYAWSYDYARSFVFIDYKFKNIRSDRRPINDMFIGIYIDGDVGHVETPNYAQDDITGFLENYIDYSRGVPETSKVYLAWIADNDGDPSRNAFTPKSPTGAMAVRVLRTPNPDLRYSFNWWISNTNEDYDWGPIWNSHFHNWGWDGTPENDKQKYQVMSSGEWDFDQTALDSLHEGTTGDNGWVEAPDNWRTLQDGYDTRFLLSFGPMTLTADSSDTPHVTIAFLVGEDFHQDPLNTGTAWNYHRFNYDNLAYAAHWVYVVFDNNGDGIPDYKGPMPPIAPKIRTINEERKIIVLWDGTLSESSIDDVTILADFEGYRIYISEANIDNYFVPLKQFDKIDYIRFERMLRLVKIDSIAGTDTFFHYEYFGIYKDSAFNTNTTYPCSIFTTGGEFVAETTLVPEPIGYNLGMPPETTLWGQRWYYHVIDNLLPGDDKYIVVTAFDFGQPSRNLLSLESSKTNNSVWAVPSGAPPTDKRVRVVPNPYRIDHDYSSFWEYSFTGTWSEYSRKLRFYNLPEKCKIRIYTLDGDLAAELDHDDNTAGKMKGAEDWNLITRNDQSIVSGIYIFSVEDLNTNEIQTGKFVIIK